MGTCVRVVTRLHRRCKGVPVLYLCPITVRTPIFDCCRAVISRLGSPGLFLLELSRKLCGEAASLNTT